MACMVLGLGEVFLFNFSAFSLSARLCDNSLDLKSSLESCEEKDKGLEALVLKVLGLLSFPKSLASFVDRVVVLVENSFGCVGGFSRVL
ncbi:hypothetical protein Mapa_010547 [Marchantia paleacea]|nr:hypothetical protein Mapa_010547 [Marchantia paleacea]